MRLDQFTMKAQEALTTAQADAEKSDHPEVATEHLLRALLNQEGGVVPAALGKLGTNVGALTQGLQDTLASLPRTQGAQTQVSGKLDAVLKAALREAESLKDQYVSTEHLLLALLDSKTPAADALKRQGVSRDGVLKVLREIRGNQRVTDPNAEDRYQALERYARDLTALARQGQAGPGHRPRRRDPPGDAGALPPHQEQPGADRRARRGQDRHRGGPGPAHRLRRRARVAEGQARGGPGPGRPDRRRQVPRRVRGPPEGRAQGGPGVRGRDHPLHRRAAHGGGRRARPRAPWTPPTC